MLIPIVMLVQLVFSMSIAILISAINVFYRDVGNLARHVLRMWFYLSPALYPPRRLVKSLTKDNPILGDIFAINPWTVMFAAYRDLLFYGQAPHWSALGILLLVSIGMIAVRDLRLQASRADVRQGAVTRWPPTR